MRRAVKYLFRSLLALVLLVVALVVSLYLPPVQRWAIDRLAVWLKGETGMELSIGRVRLTPFLDLRLEQLQLHNQSTDSLYVERVIVDLDLSRLLLLHVGVESVELAQGKIYSTALIESVALDVEIGSLKVAADDIDLRKGEVRISHVTLDDCRLDVALHKISEEDTTESAPVDWRLDIEEVCIRQSRVALQMPSDSMRIDAAIREACLSMGDVDLSNARYSLGNIRLSADSLSYDIPTAEAVKGLDMNHLRLSDLELQLDSLSFDQNAFALSAKLQRLAFREKSGLQLEDLSVSLMFDSTRVAVNELDIRTTQSSGRGRVEFDWDALSAGKHGAMQANLQASLGRQDILCLAAAYIPDELAKCFPAQSLNISIAAAGNVDTLSLHACNMTIPSVIDARTTGSLYSLTDSLALGADLMTDITTGDLSCFKNYPGLDAVHFPKMVLHADARLSKASKFSLNALLLEGQGKAHLTGDIDLKSVTYQATASITDIQLHNFLPQDSLYLFTANAKLSGSGTDMLSHRTHLQAQLDIERLDYASWDFGNIQVNCSLKDGKAMAEMSSRNDLLQVQGCVDAAIDNRKLQSTAFNLDLNRIDLHALRLSEKPFSASMVMHMDGASDFHQTHNLSARIEAMELVTADSVIHPYDLSLSANFTPELIQTRASAGDLHFTISSDQGLDSLLARCEGIGKELQVEMDSLCLRYDTLKSLLPHLQVEMECGRKNPLANVLYYATGYNFRDVSLQLQSSPAEGMNGKGHIHAFNTGAILLDSIQWKISQGEDGISLDTRVANGPKNRKVTFQSQMHTTLTPRGAEADLVFIDANGRKSVDMGLGLGLTHEGLRAHFTPLNPIIAYRKFTLNEDNFLSITRQGHLEAHVDLLADDGTGLKVYTSPGSTAKQDISVSVNKFNVGELTRVIPYMPDISGFLHGDFHYMQEDSSSTVSAEMVVEKMAYNGVRLGDIGLSAVYFPNADGSHYVDGICTQDEKEIMLLNGRYYEENGVGMMEGETTLQEVPFAFLNAFMPDGPFAMSGYASGNLAVAGNTSNPVLNGQLHTDSLNIKAESYNVNLRIPNHTISIEDSRLALNRIEAYAAGKTPLQLDGSIDFSNLERVLLDVNMLANNYPLINASKRQGSLAYGKVFVNVDGRLWGELSNLKMRGRLDVLGSTDVSCVLTDTPITVDDQLSDIVTFCDFTDTEVEELPTVAAQSIDIQMNISIAESAQIHCFLSDNGNDFIDLRGGGEMTLAYDSQNDMQLWGRYTIDKGTMRYSMMAIPLNDFKIEQGSYVEFTGNMLNPRMNINASERVRSTVTENNSPRNVVFDVGLALSRTLDDMGLEFTLQAPEDLTVQNQLASMTPEERGRVAVTMLVTGMYITDNAESNGGYNYANTLNTYLQNAINEIAGKALNTMDINFGIESGTSHTGSTTTDYTFSFAKRFWGNRISVIVGGKVSTGSDAVNNGQTIIDKISIEYRLDKTASRYVNLFYDHNYESLLEGQVAKMGGGIVLRRKADRLGELFIFRKKKEGLGSEKKGKKVKKETTE